MKIAIIHPSEIVRKGLVSIIRQLSSCEILDSPDALELKPALSQKMDLLIIFSDINLLQEDKLTFIREKINRIKTIGITNNHTPGNLPNRVDYQISIFSSQAEINSVLDSCKEEEKTDFNEHEGEELSVREKEVLKLVTLGFSNKIIAEKLFISIHTVISHRKNITEKLGIKSISGLTIYAILNNLLDTSEINPDDLI